MLIAPVLFAAKPLGKTDFTKLPEGIERIDLYLLMGQSNMKGRGEITAEEKGRESRIIMMHMTNDQWYCAQHPLHFTGDPVTLKGTGNAGVGPGMAFARALVAKDPGVLVALVPCAVGGTSLDRWEKGADLYENAVRRARLAVAESAPVPVRLAGVLWLQGEADVQNSSTYMERLTRMIHDLRMDLNRPQLPFIAATLGGFGKGSLRVPLNEILLTLPQHSLNSFCVDARDLTGHIGDNTHYDTESANEIGRRMAGAYFNLIDD